MSAFFEIVIRFSPDAVVPLQIEAKCHEDIEIVEEEETEPEEQDKR